MIDDNEKRNRYILEHASTGEDVSILNRKLIDFILDDKGIEPILVEHLVARILLLCRSNVECSLELVSVSLATALFRIYDQSGPVCLRDEIKPFVKKVN